MTVNRSDFQRRFKAEPDSGDRFIGMDTDHGSGDPFITDLAGMAGGLAPLVAVDAELSSRYAPGSPSTVGPITYTDGGIVAIEPEGTDGIDSFANMAWADAPPMRLRISRDTPDVSYGAQHFQILPYEFGMLIEYPGVVECWVKEWSIHNNNQGSPDLGGASLWIGNDDDSGGLHITATNSGGNKYASIIPELFTKASGGNLRLILRGLTDKHSFMVGAQGSEVEKISITGAGVVLIGADAHIVDGRLTVGAADSGQIAASFVSKSGAPSVDTVRIMNEFAGIQSRFNKSGAFATRVTSAPANADIANSECFFWFDATNGAAKAMFKGKTANGTVVSGSVALS